MTGDPLALGADFPVQDLESWRKTAEATLKGKPIGKLTGRTYDGVSIEPLYTRAQALPDVGLPGQTPYVRGPSSGPGEWAVAQVYTDADLERLRQTIATDVARGVQAIVLRMDGAGQRGLDGDRATAKDRAGQDGTALYRASDLAGALEAAGPTSSIHLETGAAFNSGAALLAAAWKTAQIEPDRARGSFGADPLGAWAQSGHLAAPWADTARNLADLALATRSRYPQVRSIRIDTSPYHDAGATEAQELAAALATQVAYLRALTDAGLSPADAHAQMSLHLALDADFFTGIAKVRAARGLWSRVLEACGVPPEARSVPISISTARRMMTARDPWVNILRTTVASFAGAVGGADQIVVRPFDTLAGVPDDAALRIARNTQIILKEESFLTQVIDPAGGAWFIETLTKDLAEKAWSLFQSIEKQGGMPATLESGELAKTVAESWQARTRDLAKRKAPVTGVSEYPNLGEAALEREQPKSDTISAAAQTRLADAVRTIDPVPPPNDGARFFALVNAAENGATVQALHTAQGDTSGPSIPAWPTQRYAADYEALRDASDAYLAQHGRRPRILLVNLGTIAEHTARAGFAKNFFEAGGIEAITNEGLKAPEDAVQALKDADTTVAIFCGSDPRYPELVPQYAPALKAAGVTHLFLAGRPGENEAAYRDAGVDDFIFMGGNVLGTLKTTLQKLEVTAS